jgi:DNA-binding transcriptional ArsR family regulator
MQIMLFLLERVLCTFNEIADHMQKAPSTVSLHLRSLRDVGMISITYGEYHLCSLTNKDIVCEVLAKYKASFSDRIVKSYQEMMEEL